MSSFVIQLIARSPLQSLCHFHLLLRGAQVPATCLSPRKAALFVLSKSNIPKRRRRRRGRVGGVEGGYTHSSLIAFNEPGEAGCQQDGALPRFLLARENHWGVVAAPGSVAAGRDPRAPTNLCIAHPAAGWLHGACWPWGTCSDSWE